MEELRTRSRYDIHGNLVTVVDALDRPAFRHVYDLADRPLRTDSIDAGSRRTVLDAASDDIEHRDAKGALTLRSYDVLGRPARVWARDDATSATTLRERLEYGDGGDPRQPAAERAANRAANRLGALHRHFDEAGMVTFDRYDFKGNVLDKTRQVIADAAILAAFPAAFRVDWDDPDGVLDPTGYSTSAAFDALNRITRVRSPRDVDGGRRELRPTYNRAGILERITLDSEIIVDHVAYDARGQRTLIAFGNGVQTRYAYHPRTFRLLRLRTERYTRAAGTLTFQPTGAPLQDLAYSYDLSGNIVDITDRFPGSGVTANPDAGTVNDPELRARLADGDALIRHFAYDSVYRLASATGREARGGAAGQDNAPNLTGLYRETYSYDRAGSITRLRHTTDGSDTTRQFSAVAGTNRLRSVAIGATTHAYTHDASGNVTGETDSRFFEWDHSDQMKAFRVQAGTAEPSVHAQYLYDARGQRVKKLVRRQGGAVSVTTVIDGAFEHHRWSGGGTPAGANNHLHVVDDEQRVALIRVGPAHPDDGGPAVQYHLSDHLGSSCVVADNAGGFVNREEFTPYGETSFGGFGRKRYRFTGKERDEESGLNHHGARYYAPWIARWTSCDPAGESGGMNLYGYAHANPVVLTDPHGTQPVIRPQIIDADSTNIPNADRERLPTVDPEVEFEDAAGSSRKVPLSHLRESADYIDNFDRFEAQPDPFPLSVDEITFFYARGGKLRIPMAAINVEPGSRAQRYKRSGGLIAPVGEHGTAFDAENTPAIAAAASYIQAELAIRSSTRLELAKVVYQFSAMVSALGGMSQMKVPPMRMPRRSDSANFKALEPVAPRSADPSSPATGVQVMSRRTKPDLVRGQVYNYVVDVHGSVIIAPRGHPRTGQKHSQLTFGDRAKAGGEFIVGDRRTMTLNNQSGRYMRQGAEAVRQVEKFMRKMGFKPQRTDKAFP